MIHLVPERFQAVVPLRFLPLTLQLARLPRFLALLQHLSPEADSGRRVRKVKTLRPANALPFHLPLCCNHTRTRRTHHTVRTQLLLTQHNSELRSFLSGCQDCRCSAIVCFHTPQASAVLLSFTVASQVFSFAQYECRW